MWDDNMSAESNKNKPLIFIGQMYSHNLQRQASQ